MGPSLPIIKLSRRQILLVLGSGCLISIIFSLPQILFWLDGHSGVLLLQYDEPTYGARILRVLQGHSLVGNPFTFEGRYAPNMLPPLTEYVLAIPAWLAGLDLSATLVFWRFVLPLTAILALFAVLKSFGLSVALALGVSIICLIDPGAFSYKPLLGYFLPGLATLPYNRLSNPLFGITWFFTAVWCLWAYLESPTRHRLVLAAFAIAGLFYISVYYWTHIGLAGILWALRSWHRQTFFLLLKVAGLALFLALPYLLFALNNAEHPNYETIAWRNALLVEDRGFYQLQHSTLWLFACCTLWNFTSREKTDQILGALGLSGLICYYSNLATGISLQNFHWHYGTVPFALANAALIGYRWLERSTTIRRVRTPLTVAVCLVSIFLGVKTNVELYQEVAAAAGTIRSVRKGYGHTDSEYRSAWRWLKQHSHHDQVVLSHPQSIYLVPIRTGLRIWKTNAFQFVSDEELLHRNMLIWYLDNIDDLSRHIAPPGIKKDVGDWLHGLPKSTVEDFTKNGFPTLTSKFRKELANVVADHFHALDETMFLSVMRRYRLDYVVLGPHESHWQPKLAALLDTEVIYSDGRVQILRAAWR